MTTTTAIPEQRASSTKAHRYAVGLLLIIAIATFLRFHHISRESLWGDEALSWMIARMSPPDLVRHVIWWEQIPPAHHLLLWVWIRIAGTSELSLRLPSALAGVASAAAMFIFVRRLIGPREALAAASLLAAAPLHVTYGQEARTYTLTFLVAIVATDLFVRLLSDAREKLQLAYVLAAALLLYCHLYGVFVLAAHQVAYFASLQNATRPPIQPKRWLILGVAIAALYSPWVPAVIGWVRAVNVNFWVKKVTWDDISLAYWTLAGSTPLYVAIIALTVIGVASLRKNRPDALPLLAAVALLPVVVPVAISVLGRPSFAPRYAIVAGVGLYPLAAAGLVALRPATLSVVAAVAIIALGVARLSSSDAAIPKAPWRDAVAYVEAHAKPGDIAVVHIKAKTRLYDYYAKRPDLPRRGFDSGSLPLVPPLEGDRHIWFVRHEQWAPLATQLRHGPWHVVSHKWFGDILIMELDDQFPREEGGTDYTATERR